MRAMKLEQRLLIYAPLSRNIVWEELQGAAEPLGLYTGIDRVTSYREFKACLAGGLVGIARLAAGYDRMGTAFSVINEAAGIMHPTNMAITHVPNSSLRDRIISVGLVPAGVWVLVEGITPTAFVAGKIP